MLFTLTYTCVYVNSKGKGVMGKDKQKMESMGWSHRSVGDCLPSLCESLTLVRGGGDGKH